MMVCMVDQTLKQANLSVFFDGLFAVWGYAKWLHVDYQLLTIMVHNTSESLS